MRAWMAWVMVFGVLLAGTSRASEGVTALRIGILPVLSTHTLINGYEPMRGYLERYLQRRVVFYTASGFRSFYHQTVAGEYDIVVTSVTFARIHQQDQRYLPVARYEAGVRPILVARKNGPIQEVAQLRGKVIATPDPLAAIVVAGRHWLARMDLSPGQHVTLVAAHSHNSAVATMLRGEASAALTSPPALRAMPKDFQQSVQVLAEGDRLPGLVYMAHPSLSSELVGQVRGALNSYAATSNGEADLQARGRGGIRPVEISDLKIADPYLRETRRLLE